VSGASLTRNSIARLIAEGSILAIALVTAVITARWLGADGKGLLSSISYLAMLILNIGLLGLAETQIVLVGQKRATLDRAYSSTVTASLFLGALSAAAMWAIAFFEFRRDWSVAALPALLLALSIPAGMLWQAAAHVLNARERMVASSALLVFNAVAIVTGTVLLVMVFRRGILGAALAVAAASALSALAGLAMVRRIGVHLALSWDGAYLREAARLGVRLQLATLFVSMASRFDQLLVYSLAGARDAGIYSVALTCGSLAFLPPFALAYATFPRLAGLGADEAAELTARGARVAMVITTLAGIPLALLVPLAIRLAFGPSFAPAAVPAIILIGGSVVLAAQYFLARGRAAQGDPRLVLESFAITAVVMIALDYLAIPRFGLIGAACASVAGNIAGLLRCIAASGWRARSLVPRAGELMDAAMSLRRTFGL
jgi:O-antigen/teichoic acid export membrane protein